MNLSGKDVVSASASCKVSNFAQVADSTPINRQALQITKRGNRFEVTGHPDRLGLSSDIANKKIVQKHWVVPPPCQPLPRGCQEDLTGIRFARFVVIGFYRQRSDGMAWICRCVCGRYETRKRKGIKNPKSTWDSCSRCIHLMDLKMRDYFERTGLRVKREDL